MPDVVPWARGMAGGRVELAPDLDPSGGSTILAAKVARKIVLCLANSR